MKTNQLVEETQLIDELVFSKLIPANPRSIDKQNVSLSGDTTQ